jgi:acid phosphatase
LVRLLSFTASHLQLDSKTNPELLIFSLMGELTDRGRETTLALGERLRKLYVDDLKFLPEQLSHPDEYYLRATSIVRARESLQQVFTGLYPAQYRMLAHPPVIHSRVPQDENLSPNDINCRRFNQLARSFAKLAAEKWNNTPEMMFLQEKIGKWMPEGEKVAVDAHPRLAGLQDSVNSTLAHGPATKLPEEFYDPEVKKLMNDITVDEWFRGYKQSTEYRRLGVGSLLGDLKNRAVAVVNGQSDIRIALMGCHDTTIAGILATLGAFDHEWPPFTSSIAIETFRLRDHRQSFWDKMMGRNAEQSWYVRLRYNEKPIAVNGCKKPGKHLEGDESFCTMTAFREIVEKYAPSSWKNECLVNLDKPGIPPFEELD